MSRNAALPPGRDAPPADDTTSATFSLPAAPSDDGEDKNPASAVAAPAVGVSQGSWTLILSMDVPPCGPASAGPTCACGPDLEVLEDGRCDAGGAVAGEIAVVVDSEHREVVPVPLDHRRSAHA